MSAVGQEVAKLAREEFRVSSTDVDAGRVNRKAEVAIELVTGYIDPPVPWVDDPEKWPASVIEAAVVVTRELCNRKDFGLVGALDDGTVARTSADPLAGVKAMLAPHKQRWGIA